MKNKLRQISLEKRKAFNVSSISKKVIENLLALDEYKNAKNILNYYPLKYEIQTTECFNDKRKNWYIPRVNGKNLEICRYNKNFLEIGSFGIKEIRKNIPPESEKMDIIIIPAVACDIYGYRIGYGKGFYDRFLSSLKYNPIKILLIYDELLYENIFPEKFDIKADIIITENKILKV